MKLWLVLTFLIVSWSRAATFRTRIYSIDKGLRASEDHLVKMENGRVAFIDQDSPLNRQLQVYLHQHALLEFKMNQQNKIMSVRKL